MTPLLLVPTLAMLLDPLRVVTQLEGDDVRPGVELRYVLSIQWPGDPRDGEIVELPAPRVENFQVVGITRAARRRLVHGVPVTVMEIGYRLQPLHPGPARFAPSRLVCALGGTSHVLEAEGLDLRVPEPPSRAWAWPLGAGVVVGVVAAGAAVRHARRRPREAAPPALRSAPDDLDPAELDRLDLEALVRRARALGIELPAEVAQACELYKFAGEAPDPLVAGSLREKIRARSAAEPGAGL